MKHEPVKDHAERKRLLALIERCEKEQTMSDALIKREDVLNVLKLYGYLPLDSLYYTIEHDLPSADIDLSEYSDKLWRNAYERGKADRPQGWIPCSERLPSEKGMYLVTSREKATAEEFGFDLDDVEVKKMRFDEDGWRIPKHIPEWINGVVHTTVLAWMPLPKPYGEREGE